MSSQSSLVNLSLLRLLREHRGGAMGRSVADSKTAASLKAYPSMQTNNSRKLGPWSSLCDSQAFQI